MRRFLRWVPPAAVIAALAVGFAAPSEANWLTRLAREAGEAGGAAGMKAGRLGLGALDEAAGHVAKLPRVGQGTALAAHATPEGHWRFASREGEVFTAATPAEMARVRQALAPDAPPGGPLSLYLSADTVFARRNLLGELPDAELSVVVGKDAYKLRTPRAGGDLIAEFRPNVAVALTGLALFKEAVAKLARPLDKARIRVLALEPGGPKGLAASPRRDPKSRAALVDRIDPELLPQAFANLRGQTALITGRVEGGSIVVRPSRGAERSLGIADLVSAAERADVNLVVLKASAAHQPGGRNWLWQRIAVTGLDDALTRATFADFLSALGGGGELAVRAASGSQGRVVLTAIPEPGMTAPVTDTLGHWIGEISGHVVSQAIEIHARDDARQRELDSRIVPGIPSDIQFLYIGALAMGVIGFAVARGWWLRIWPPERRGEYAGRLGYWAARIVRGLVFVLVFLPLVGIPAVIWTGVLWIWSLLTVPVRAWSWLRGRSA